jgi:hypothetical protein
MRLVKLFVQVNDERVLRQGVGVLPLTSDSFVYFDEVSSLTCYHRYLINQGSLVESPIHGTPFFAYDLDDIDGGAWVLWNTAVAKRIILAELENPVFWEGQKEYMLINGLWDSGRVYTFWNGTLDIKSQEKTPVSRGTVLLTQAKIKGFLTGEEAFEHVKS